jgi:hypothetical protein
MTPKASVSVLDLFDGRGACGVCPGSPELKAAGTGTRFSNSPIRGHEEAVCGGVPQAFASEGTGNMLTEESKRALYAQARDDAERQRLLAAFRTDGKTEATRELFEQLAFLIIIGSASFLAAILVTCVAAYAPLLSSRPKWLFAIFFGVLLVTAIGINRSFDGDKGERRRAGLELASRRYGYPILVATGLCAGWFAHQYHEGRSDLAAIKTATVRACLQSASCVSNATAISGGLDPRYYLGPEGKPF